MLRAVDYGDADRILTLFTREAGVVAAMARGLRRGSRRFPGGAPALAALEAEIALGRGEVGRLAQAAPTESFPGLLRDLVRLESAGRALERLRRMLPPRQPEPEVFDVTLELLRRLEHASPDEARAHGVGFRARVAALLGLEPTLDRCGTCGARPGDAQAALFDPTAGTLVCRACGGGSIRLSAAARRALAVGVSERWVELGAPAGEGERFTEADVGLAEAALDAFLDWFAGRAR